MAQARSRQWSFDSVVNGGGFIVLLAITFLARLPPLYDEPHRLEVVAALRERGLTHEFIRHMPHATGLLTSVLQLTLAPLTHLQMPGLRVTNAVLLSAIIVLIALVLRRRGSAFAWANAFAIMSLPTTWIVSGLALTEVPAMTFVAIGVLALTFLQEKARGWDVLPVALAAGGAFGLAALGRQPYLMLGATLPLAGWNRPSHWFALTLAVLVSLLPIGWIITVWGGLVPPHNAALDGGLAPRHVILAFAYAGAFTLLFAPSWLVLLPRVVWLLAAVAALNLAFGTFEVLPMASVSHRVLSSGLVAVANRVVGSGFLALALWFLVSLGWRAWGQRHDALVVFLSLGVLLLLVSTLKITANFSSRYVAMTFPLLLPLLTPSRDSASSLAAWRSLLGNALGAASLVSYLQAGSAG